jgi:serralysin
VEGGKTIITYSFGTASSEYSTASGGFQNTLSAFSAADKALTREILASIEAVCNVKFVEVADSGASYGLLRYAYSQKTNEMGFAGYAFFPSTSEIGGDVWLGAAQAGPEWDHYRPNLLLHETLHAIGLKHPFEGGAVLSTSADIMPNTVMSYSTIAGLRNGSLTDYPREPMPYDVSALQQIYGAAATNAGNTVYDLSSDAFVHFRALWDASGTDTLDASRCSQGVSLDLEAGARSSLGHTITAFAYQPGGLAQQSYGDTLALSALCQIENATGSGFDDVLRGNAGANVIKGGAGDDRIEGRGGRDTIDGGTGDDTVLFGGKRADYKVEENGGTIVVTQLKNTANVATLTQVERVEFADQVLEARPTQAPQVLLEGLSGQAFRLYNAALDRLPDEPGLAYQTNALKQGLPLRELAANFMASPEFQTRFNVPSNKDFVTLLYQNVLERAPEADGLAYHLARMDAGAQRSDILVGFSESPENQAAVVGMGYQIELVPA